MIHGNFEHPHLFSFAKNLDEFYAKKQKKSSTFMILSIQNASSG